VPLDQQLAGVPAIRLLFVSGIAGGLGRPVRPVFRLEVASSRRAMGVRAEWPVSPRRPGPFQEVSRVHT